MFVYKSGNAQTDTITDKDGNIYTVKIMSDRNHWITNNLNLNIEESYCYQNNPAYCKEYGRLYTFQSAQKACNLLGEGWRLPTNQEWEQMADQYGGIREKSTDSGRKVFKELLVGGNAGFNAMLGGNRELDGKGYARLKGHGLYWTATENGNNVWFYNFGSGLKMLTRHEDGEKSRGFSVRCIRTVK